jgi:F-type H+-transporting ATPase subunit delta
VTIQTQLVTGMPGRYATALFELANEAGAIDQVEQDFDGFDRMLDGSPDLWRLVRSPVYSAEEQIRALGAILERAGAATLTTNFLKLTARNRRLFAIRDMIKAYRTLIAAARGEVSAEVVSAHELSSGQVQALKAELKAAEARDVKLTQRVDPAILGGLIVRVGSRMIDNSLRTKLQSLKVSMKGTV